MSTIAQSPARDFEISWFGSIAPNDPSEPTSLPFVRSLTLSAKHPLKHERQAQTSYFGSIRDAAMVEYALPESSTSAGISTTHPPPSLRSAVMRRVRTLVKYALADKESLPDQQSLRGLLAFIETQANIREPLLTTDHIGLLVATWKIDNEQMLSIKFNGIDAIDYAWARRNTRGKLERNWGSAKWRTFLPSFPFGPAFFGGGQ